MEELTPTPDHWLDMGACVGRQQAFAVIANKCSAAQALSLKQMKEAGCHEQLGLSWDDFCGRYIGLSRRQADRIIGQYNEFGEAYFHLSTLARISAEDYRALSGTVADNCIEIDGESVALIPENAGRIRAFIRAQRAPRSARAEQQEPGLSPVIDIRLRLRELVRDAHVCLGRRLSAEDREDLQQTVGGAIQAFVEIGHRLDKLDKGR